MTGSSSSSSSSSLHNPEGIGFNNNYLWDFSNNSDNSPSAKVNVVAIQQFHNLPLTAETKKRKRGEEDNTSPSSQDIQNQIIENETNPRAIVAIYLKYFDMLEPIHICTALHRIAKYYSIRPEEIRNWIGQHSYFLQSISKKICNNISSVEAYQISIIFWSLAHLDYKDQLLMHDLAEQACQKVNSFKSINISKIIWACASLEYKHSRLLALLAAKTKNEILSFDNQNIANTLWGFGKLLAGEAEIQTTINPLFFKRLIQAVLLTLRYNTKGGFKPVEMGMIVRGLSNFSPHLAEYPELVSECCTRLANHALSKIVDFDVHQTAVLLQAIIHLPEQKENPWKPVVISLAQRVLQLLKNNSKYLPRDISGLLYALINLEYYNKELFETLEKGAIGQVSSLTVGNMANLGWSLVKGGHGSPTLFKELSQELEVKILSASSYEVAVLAWAFSVADCSPSDFHWLRNWFNRVKQQPQIVQTLNRRELLHLHQTHLHLISKGTELDNWPDALLSKIKGALQSHQDQREQFIGLRYLNPSYRKIEDLLLQLLSSQFQKQYDWEGYYLDFADPVNKWCIELESLPTPMGDQKPREGNKLLRRRLLRENGWVVITITEQDWEMLRNDDEKKAFLKSTLSYVLKVGKA